MKRLIALVCCLSACATPPQPLSSKVNLPPQFVEDGDWIVHAAEARPRGAWWKGFNDAALDMLLARAETGNPNLAVAAARYRAATALLARIEAEQRPQAGLEAGAKLGSRTKRDASLGLAASWEIDLWGRTVLRTDAARADAAASQSDLDAARLSLQALTVEAWYRLQTARQKQALLQQAIETQAQLQHRIAARFEAGVGTGLDVASAAEAMETLKVRAERAALEQSLARSALAELLGEPDWQASESQPLPMLVAPPKTLPSTLLRGRPDITAAAQRVAAANARMGLAQSAWYPTLDLGASAGLSGSSLNQLLSRPLQTWSLGPSLALTVLDFGARQQDVDKARAEADAATASYRETVLRAFRETEDALAAVRWLDRAAQHQTAALQAADAAQQLATARFDAGTVSRLEVLLATRNALDARIATLELWRERLVARVALLKIQG
jgi:NodT family efflux transporter outer membrane factor (OMF) lipoprotein